MRRFQILFAVMILLSVLTGCAGFVEKREKLVAMDGGDVVYKGTSWKVRELNLRTDQAVIFHPNGVTLVVDIDDIDLPGR